MTDNRQDIRVDGERLWQSLMDMAQIGGTPKGGSCRLALTDEDRDGRDLFVRWCREAGCSVDIDGIGNIFARRPGTDPSKAPVATGSHLDTQPHGGKFDGVYGVLAGLEVIRTLNDRNVATAAPIEAVVWTNEEGARFAPGMMGSAAFSGSKPLSEILDVRDAEGLRCGDELERIGYAGPQPCGERPFAAFFESHIEQGPILEAENKTIGVVTRVQGMRWFDVTVTGRDAHAGSTPMNRRIDAMAGAAHMVAAVEDIALSHAPAMVATVGQLSISPNARNTIPGEVTFAIDLRDPSAASLDGAEADIRTGFAEIATGRKLAVEVDRITDTAPVIFDEACVTAVRTGADAVGLSHRDMLSGAGHDSCLVSAVAPTAMVFVPCADGLSHNEAESATPEDLAAGCNVLLQAMLSRAG